MFTKFKKLITDACVLFTAFTFLLYLVGYITVSQTITLTLGSVFALLGLCILLCILNKVLFIERLPFFVRILIHYLLVLGSSFLLFGVFGKIISTSLASLFMLAAVTLAYSVIMLIFSLIRSKKESNEEYHSMFKK